MKKICVLIVFLCFISGSVFAKPANVKSENVMNDRKMEQSFFISLGYVAVTGNAETSTGNVELEHKFSYNKFLFVTSGKFIFTDVDSEDGTQTRKTEKYNAAFKFNYNIDNQKSYFANLSWERDIPSGIEKSFSLASGLDITTLFSKNHKIKTGFGIEAFNESRIHEDSYNSTDKIAGYMQVLYNVQLSENNFLVVENQSRMNFSDREDYRVTNNISYLSHINKTLALKVIYNYDYKNLPVEGKKKLNTTTTVSLMFKF